MCCVWPSTYAHSQLLMLHTEKQTSYFSVCNTHIYVQYVKIMQVCEYRYLLLTCLCVLSPVLP